MKTKFVKCGLFQQTCRYADDFLRNLFLLVLPVCIIQLFHSPDHPDVCGLHARAHKCARPAQQSVKLVARGDSDYICDWPSVKAH